ncbi:hypothetical protein QNM99_17210 [Pseudomonas sp. PCH446]
MSDQDTMLVEITGNYRSGTSGKGNPYCMFEGYVHLPNMPYPEKASFYAEKVSEVPQAGTYRVPFKFQVKDVVLRLILILAMVFVLSCRLCRLCAHSQRPRNL